MHTNIVCSPSTKYRNGRKKTVKSRQMQPSSSNCPPQLLCTDGRAYTTIAYYPACMCSRGTAMPSCLSVGKKKECFKQGS